MKERRKRRSAKDIKESIINAATHSIETEGFSNLTVMIRDNKKVYEIAKMLQEKGIFTIGIVYPAVRTKEARLRVSVLATHKLEQLESLVNTLNDINKNIKIK